MKAYLENHPIDHSDDDCTTVLDQLYLARTNSHGSNPPEIREGFKELEAFLHILPLSDNNAVCNLCCRLCAAYACKAVLYSLQYGAHLILERNRNIVVLNIEF